jgi:hypothetical protein
MNASDNGAILNILWLAFIGGALILVGLFLCSRLKLRIGPIKPRLEVDDFVGLMFALPGPLAVIWGAGDYIVKSRAGHWTPGDFRSTNAFVVGCWFFIVVVAPLVSLAGFRGLWIAHRHRR